MLPGLKALFLIAWHLEWVEVGGKALEGVTTKSMLMHSPLSLALLVSGVVLLGMSQAFKPGGNLPVAEAAPNDGS